MIQTMVRIIAFIWCSGNGPFCLFKELLQTSCLSVDFPRQGSSSPSPFDLTMEVGRPTSMIRQVSQRNAFIWCSGHGPRDCPLQAASTSPPVQSLHPRGSIFKSTLQVFSRCALYLNHSGAPWHSLIVQITSLGFLIDVLNQLTTLLSQCPLY